MATTVSNPTKADILEMAKKLSWDERWELIVELRGTIIPPPPPDGMTAEEFRAELDRRWQAHLADPSKARPVEEVIEELRRKNRRHG
jgi:putative addiction module component (TIGR02574 family)